MENASKALIIAGAIMISIVLVTVGVIVVQSLNPDEALSSMSQQEIESFNSKFVGSTGNNRQGSLVRTLITTVMTNNAQYSDDTTRQVKITTSGLGTDVTEEVQPNELTKVRNAINGSYRYDVGYEVNEKNGQVTTITIIKK